MKPNREEMRARMLARAENMIDNVLDWETIAVEPTKIEVQEKLSVESRQLGEELVSILLTSDDAKTPASREDVEEDFEIEIRDLPSDAISGLPAAFLKLSLQFSPQKRRQALRVAAFLFLIILLILSNIPAIHDRVWNTLSTFLPVTPTPTVEPGPQSNTSSDDLSQIEFSPTLQGTGRVVIWSVSSARATLGRVPHNCPPPKRTRTTRQL